MSASENPPEQRPALRIITPDASAEEIAALTAIFAAIGGAEPPAKRPVKAWAAPSRKMRLSPPHGRGGWRASALPR